MKPQLITIYRESNDPSGLHNPYIVMTGSRVSILPEANICLTDSTIAIPGIKVTCEKGSLLNQNGQADYAALLDSIDATDADTRWPLDQQKMALLYSVERPTIWQTNAVIVDGCRLRLRLGQTDGSEEGTVTINLPKLSGDVAFELASNKDKRTLELRLDSKPRIFNMVVKDYRNGLLYRETFAGSCLGIDPYCETFTIT